MKQRQTPSEIIKEIKEHKKSVEFLPTGFPTLDKDLDNGFMRKELVLLGAYTGIGKSFFAGTILYNIASKGFVSAYFSLEISNHMVVSRLVGSIANIKPTKLMTWDLEEAENKARIEAEAQVETLDDMIFIYDELYEFTAIKAEILKHKYDFIVIDFVQNIFSPQHREEYDRLSFIALQLQQLAKETNSCILLLSQLSNEAARRGLMEYKGSGSIQTVADLGFFLVRDKAIGAQENDVKLMLRKNRRGISGREYEFIFKQPGGMLHEKF